MYSSFLWLFVPLTLLWFTQNRATVVNYVHLVILLLITLALSRPVLNGGLQKSFIEAQDVVVALDVSYSMRAEDISPSRYIFAKKTIESFLKLNVKDNIMLIAFTSNPLLLSPPTTDHQLVSTALKSLQIEYILTKGTSLEKLFSKLQMLQRRERTLILVTDGGEGEDVQKLAKQLKQADIKLITLALGSKKGTTVKKPDGTLLKDAQNSLVVTRVHPMLKELNSLVDGEYLEALDTPNATAKAVQSSLESLNNKTKTISKEQQTYTELYQVPLFLAFVLFLMLHTRAVKYLVVLFMFFGISLEASVLDVFYLNSAYSSYHKEDYNATKRALKELEDESLESRVLLANTYYRQREYKKAIGLYHSIQSTSTKVKQELYYNSANAYAMLGKYDKAEAYYVKALQLGEDEDALSNLKLVALLTNRLNAKLGIANPKSQSSSSSKSEAPKSKEDTKQNRDENQASSGSGMGGESKKEKHSSKEKQRLILDENEEKQPLSSKVYELINKGYIREKQPW
jgi:Ca-activated chloride channel family protein